MGKFTKEGDRDPGSDPIRSFLRTKKDFPGNASSVIQTQFSHLSRKVK